MTHLHIFLVIIVTVTFLSTSSSSQSNNTSDATPYDCDPADPRNWTCFNYHGIRDFGETCMSDGEKRDRFVSEIDPHGDGNTTYDHAAITEIMNNQSCDTRKFLECREVGSTPDHQPKYECTCPDHEKGDSPDAVKKSLAYYDKELGHCVLKVRAKCVNLVIPDRAKRLNGSQRFLTQGMVRVVDGRHQWLSMPCVRHAYCNIIPSNISSLPPSLVVGRSHKPISPEDNAVTSIHEGEDEDVSGGGTYRKTAFNHLENRCDCDTGYISEEDDECHLIDTNELGFYPILGLILIVVAFSLTFYFLVCQDDANYYHEKGYGRF